MKHLSPCSKSIRWSALCLGLACLLGSVRGEGRLQPGADRIDVPAQGEGLWLHNLFQSNMVLQRDKPIRIWGWADASGTVRVSFAGHEEQTRAAADRSWSVTFPAMAASAEPMEMVIAGEDKTVTLGNILIGDVWVLGGQSNMEHPLARTEGGRLEIQSAHFEKMRILTPPQLNGPDEKLNFPRVHEWHSFFRTHYPRGNWDVCSPEAVDELSAIGYVFARRIHMAAQIPIGVIDISRGGTSLETWLPASTLRGMRTPEVEAMLAEWDAKVAAYSPEKSLAGEITRYEQWAANLKKQGKEVPADRKPPTEPKPSPAMDMNHPGNCYASILRPIAGLPVKGAIWHQGYNNAAQPEGHRMYYQVFPKMIEAWRAAFGDPELPFGIISLCTDGTSQTLDNYLEMMVNEGMYIREVQYRTFLDLAEAGDRNIGFVSSYDQRRNWYHPQLKVPVGERIATWALATQYGQNGLSWKPPEITGVEAGEGTLTLAFDVPVDQPSDYPIEGFAIAGEDRMFQPAVAEHAVTGVDGRNQPVKDFRRIVLSSPHVKDPVHFRYAWGRNPMGNLYPRFAKDGQPLATQRSDDWRIHEVPVVFGEEPSRQTMDLARQAMRLFDMDRRLKDAARLLEEHQEAHTKALQNWEAQWLTPPDGEGR